MEFMQHQLVSNNTGLAELIQATASHSGNLVEIQDSSNQKLLEISNSGDIVINAYNTASTNERNLSFVRYGAVGNTTNPKFQLGRVIAGGINVPEIRFMYSDLNETERSVFEIENTGTIGSVKPCTWWKHLSPRYSLHQSRHELTCFMDDK